MKKIELKLGIPMDLCEVALDEAIDLFRRTLKEERNEELIQLKLTVSIFDVKFATNQMIHNPLIGNVIISKHLAYGEWRLETWSGEFYMLQFRVG